MKHWIEVTLLLCTFGALREIRPSEPYVSEYLMGPWRNITKDQLNREVYPVGTYSYLSQLVIVFLVTDFLRFKPIIILSGLSGIVVYSILLWTSSVPWLQACQYFYGLYMATEVAYFTYIYAKVESAKYPRVTSYMRMAALSGRFFSGVSSQLLVFFNILDYRELNYITFAAQILATFWAFWLPQVMFSIYFHRRKALINQARRDSDEIDEPELPEPPEPPELPEPPKPVEDSVQPTFKMRVKEAWFLILTHARAAYTRKRVPAWSALYAASLALYVQTQTYVQLLWNEKQCSYESKYNGAAEAATTLIGALGAFLSSEWRSSSMPAPAAATQAFALFLAARLPLLVSYLGYVVTGVIYHYLITLSSAKIASELADESCFGLIFGINTFIGTGLQSILTSILTQSAILHITTQYYVISGLYLLLSGAWLAYWAVKHYKKKNVTFNLHEVNNMQ